ncbi:MAG: HlyD family efflux transporter periplasmic adaptor subunit [Planctomycetaceae bacterium]
MRRFVLPVLAIIAAVFAITHALKIQKPQPETGPPVSPPIAPFGNTVAGAGMIEASTNASGTGNITVGSQVAGMVAKVLVTVGQNVHAGEVLIELDSRQAAANLRFQQAVLKAAEQQLRKLQLLPRPEEIPASEAQVAAAEANLREMQDRFARAEKLKQAGRAIAEEDYVASQLAVTSARAQFEQTTAALALLRAGAWEADKAIAAAAVEQARAQVDQAQTALDLLQVRAPVDGTILQVDVRPGEYVSTFGGQSLILMGNLQPMHVRVNIDEEDLPRLRLDARAAAKIRGDVTQEEIPLTFVRLEPYVVPKASLTGVNTERVDTRVVQVIFAVDPQNRLVQEQKLLVGQLVDVFLEADLRSDSPRTVPTEPLTTTRPNQTSSDPPPQFRSDQTQSDSAP